jgi:hypothetical protein
METVEVVFLAMAAIASSLVAILVWRRLGDPSSRLLKWAILLFPCAGGLLVSLGGLFLLLGRSRTMEVLGEMLVGAALVAFVLHMCLLTVHGLGRLSSQDGHRG